MKIKRKTFRQTQEALGSHLWPGEMDKIKFIKLGELQGRTGKLQGYLLMDLSLAGLSVKEEIRDIKGAALLMGDGAYIFLNVGGIQKTNIEQVEVMVVPVEKFREAHNMDKGLCIVRQEDCHGHQPSLTWKVTMPHQARLLYDPLNIEVGKVTHNMTRGQEAGATWVYPSVQIDPSLLASVMQHGKAEEEKKRLTRLGKGQIKAQTKFIKL